MKHVWSAEWSSFLDKKVGKKRLTLYWLVKYDVCKRRRICFFMDRAEAELTKRHLAQCTPMVKYALERQSCP